MPILRNYRRWSYDSRSRRIYSYDIWSNLHYGYIGLAAGFSEEMLLFAAGVANWKDNWLAPIDFGLALDDPDDQAAIRVGFRLWHQYGSAVPYEAVLETVRSDAGNLKTWPCDLGSLVKN